MKASLAVAALRNAIALRAPAAGLIVHSDRGSQFRSKKFVRVLKAHQLRGSMGRVGACGDNAAMESFFALLQKNVLNRQRWTSYHRRRRQRRSQNSHPSSLRQFNPPPRGLNHHTPRVN
jgi:putative transposase